MAQDTARTLPPAPGAGPAPAALDAFAAGRPRFPLFDSLRAIAAIAVVGTHAAFFAGAYARPGLAAKLAGRLECGVTVFFVISGYLLYRPFAAAHLEGRATPPLRDYALRRVVRIVPAYWLALTVAALWTGLPGVFTAGGVPTYYLFAQTYRTATIGGGLVPAWSLCIEIAFYAFLPAWAWLVRRRRRGARGVRGELGALALLAIAAFVWKAVVLVLQAQPRQVRIEPALLALPAYLDQFAIGMALAVVSVRNRELAAAPGRAWRLLARRPAAGWALALAAYLAAALALGISGQFFAPMSAWQYVGRHVLYGLVGLGMVLPAVTGSPGEGLVRRLLARRELLWLGTISYGIYLWHDAVLDRLAHAGWGDATLIHPYVWWPVGGLAGACVLAAASWYGLERPLLRWVHRATGGRR